MQWGNDSSSPTNTVWPTIFANKSLAVKVVLRNFVVFHKKKPEARRPDIYGMVYHGVSWRRKIFSMPSLLVIKKWVDRTKNVAFLRPVRIQMSQCYRLMKLNISFRLLLLEFSSLWRNFHLRPHKHEIWFLILCGTVWRYKTFYLVERKFWNFSWKIAFISNFDFMIRSKKVMALKLFRAN